MIPALHRNRILLKYQIFLYFRVIAEITTTSWVQNILADTCIDKASVTAAKQNEPVDIRHSAQLKTHFHEVSLPEFLSHVDESPPFS